jgi:hypothetical protein
LGIQYKKETKNKKAKKERKRSHFFQVFFPCNYLQ